MSKNIKKLTTPQKVEEAFVKLFNRIDDGICNYLDSIHDISLKEQAMRNVVSMLKIMRIINQRDLQMLYRSELDSVNSEKISKAS